MDTTHDSLLSPDRRDDYGDHSLRVDALASLPLLLRLPFQSTDAWLYGICLANDVLRIERTAEGNLIIGPPAGFKSGHRKAAIVAQRRW